MLTSVAGTDFTLASGSIVELSQEFAYALIKANYAVPVDLNDDAVGENVDYEKRPIKRKYERRQS
ncbi:MAG: hypothetical protein ABIK73_07440 [candidate division WOR-3 bacterium]